MEASARALAYCSLPYFLETGTQTPLHFFAYIGSQQAPLTLSLSHSPMVLDYKSAWPHLALYMSSGDLNFYPHA